MNSVNRTAEERRRQTLCETGKARQLSLNSAKIQPSLKRSFRKRPENIHLKLVSRQNRKIIALSRLCHTQMFCRPLLSVVLFRKHTSEFTQQEGRKKRTAKRLCDKRDRAITWDFCGGLPLTLMFLVFYKTICSKKGVVWRYVFSNKIIVTIVTQGLTSSFLFRLVGWVHYY